MANFFVLTLLILQVSQLALSEDKDRERCSPTCSTCYKDKKGCPGTECSSPGNCTIYTLDSCGCCYICAKLERESCGGLHGVAGFCANHLRCTVSERRALAGKTSAVGICKDKYCFRTCTNTKQSRVCGSDGKWYKSECALKQLNCDNGTNIKEVDDAICEKNCPTSCKGVLYSPVCGSDKKMYSNTCKLKQKACLFGRNITVAPRQLCSNNPISVDPCSRVKCGQGEKCVIKVNEKKTDKFAQCQCISVTDNCFESFHVCASDNNTYKSVCHMDAAACASKKSLTVLYDEDCKHSGSGGGNLPGPPYIPPPNTTSKPKDPFNEQWNPQT